jgi:hypothetical protein
MSVLKYKDPTTGIWYPIIKGPKGDKGDQGVPGVDGADGADGEITQAAGDARYVKQSGDKIFGHLTFDTLPQATVEAAADTFVRFNVSVPDSASSKPRWRIARINTEHTGNLTAGSDLVISAYNNNGSLINDPLSISRQTQEVTVAINPISNLGVATKQYVDNRAAAGVITGVSAVGVGLSTTVVATFPAGRFSVSPVVVAMSNTHRLMATLVSVSATSATISLTNYSTGSTLAGTIVHWHARVAD